MGALWKATHLQTTQLDDKVTSRMTKPAQNLAGSRTPILVLHFHANLSQGLPYSLVRVVKSLLGGTDVSVAEKDLQSNTTAGLYGLQAAVLAGLPSEVAD